MRKKKFKLKRGDWVTFNWKIYGKILSVDKEKGYIIQEGKNQYYFFRDKDVEKI